MIAGISFGTQLKQWPEKQGLGLGTNSFAPDRSARMSETSSQVISDILEHMTARSLCSCWVVCTAGMKEFPPWNTKTTRMLNNMLLCMSLARFIHLVLSSFMVVIAII